MYASFYSMSFVQIMFPSNFLVNNAYGAHQNTCMFSYKVSVIVAWCWSEFNCQHILVKFPKVNLYGNVFSVSEVVSWPHRHGKGCRQMLQLPIVNIKYLIYLKKSRT